LNKSFQIFLLIFVIILVVFSTWQLFMGNLEAAFSMFPFLVIIFFLIKKKKE